MPAQFVHDGMSIDYTPSVAVTAGDVVVLGDLIGISKRDIAANTLGALAVGGVFDLPNATGADTAIDDASILIERNHIVDSTKGVVIEQGAIAVERGNTFHNVKWPLVWSPPRESSMAVFNQPETREPESTRSESAS